MKEYVSFAIAEQLKRTGFNEPCCTSYDSDGEFDSGRIEDYNTKYDSIISAPSMLHVAEWLRQKGIFIDVITIYDENPDEIRQFLPHPQYYFKVRIYYYKKWEELPMTYLEWDDALMTGIQASLNYLNGIGAG